MKVRRLIEQIERRAQHKLTRSVPENHYEIRLLMSESLNDLAGYGEFDFLKVVAEPLIQTETSVRAYDLPEEFPMNFCSYVDPITGESSYACKIDDGSSGSSIPYEAPERFHSRDLSSESDSRPDRYTILTLPNGGRQIVLSPPPDSTGYVIQGTYVPNEWKLDDDDELPVLPNNFAVLRYDVLRQIDPDNIKHEQRWIQAFTNLMIQHAQQSPGQFSVHPLEEFI